MLTQAYFTVPKALHEAPYVGLSVRARYLYGFLRDRRGLSEKNGWQDGGGVFVIMSRRAMAQLLGVSVPTARQALRELTAAGLLEEKRVGLTRCNKLYVRPLAGEDQNHDALPSKGKGGVPSRKKHAFSPEGKPFAPNKPEVPSLTTKNPYKYRPNGGKEQIQQPKGRITAQQYTQRTYRPEDLQRLIEVI